MKDKHAVNIALLVFATSVFVWAIWQHDLIVSPHVGPHWNEPFAFFWGIHTQLGLAYDVTLLLEFLSYVLALVSLWFWSEND